MSEFKFELSSGHSPDEVWEGLRAPLSPELNHIVNSQKVFLDYEELGEDGRIRQGTRLIYTPNSTALNAFFRLYEKFAPERGTGVVDSLSPGSKTRVDVVEPGQIARGHMQYRVEEDEGGTALLLVQGEFAVEGLAEAITKVWPRRLGDINEWSIKYGIRNPAERLLEHVPVILAA